MGGVGTALAAINAGLGVAGTVSGIQQGKAQASYQAQQNALQLTAQRAERSRQLQAVEEERKAQTARARAALGASGVGSGQGSGAAVIGQLNRKADENRLQLLSGYGLEDEALGLLRQRSGGSQAENLLTLGQSAMSFGKSLDDLFN